MVFVSCGRNMGVLRPGPTKAIGSFWLDVEARRSLQSLSTLGFFGGLAFVEIWGQNPFLGLCRSYIGKCTA